MAMTKERLHLMGAGKSPKLKQNARIGDHQRPTTSAWSDQTLSKMVGGARAGLKPTLLMVVITVWPVHMAFMTTFGTISKDFPRYLRAPKRVRFFRG